jgi:lipopolysaccharide export system protein LptA
MTRLDPRSLLVAFAVLAFAGGASAQNSPPNALQGFSQNRDQPVKIDAATLEVRDKDKVATFGGNVHLVQGDTTLRCTTLVVFYDQGGGGTAAPNTMKAATPVGPGGNQSIKRLEAKGGVIVTQKDQTATGDNGVFDMKSNTVTLIGKVVISQGPQVIEGDRLVVNLTTGVSRVECDSNPGKQCRVRALLHPGAGKSEASPSQSSGPASAPARDTPKPRPSSPSGVY